MKNSNIVKRDARRAMLLASSVLASLGFGGTAFAQDASEDPGLQDIIVTAQKREQSLQDVPIAITALSQDAIRANRITNVLDLAAQAPNLAIRNAAGGTRIPNFSMRGSVSFGSVAGQDKAISLYLDGVYIGTSQGSTFELPDLERIEVLRGPQGTLFGRNATAGAISIITREPSGEFGLRQLVSYGNYDQLRSSTRVELPQIGPFSASLSYTHFERTGDIRNLGAGTVWDRRGPDTRQGVQVSPKTLGDENTESVFAALKFEPSDAFKMVYKFDYMNGSFTPQGSALVVINPSALGAAGAPLAAAYAANPVPLATKHRPKAVNNSFSTAGFQKVQGHNLTSKFEISDSLSLTNILAYRKSYLFGNADIAGAGGLVVTPTVASALETLQNRPAGSLAALIGSPYVASGSNAAVFGRQWSDEIQLNYDSDFVTITAGAIWFDLKGRTGSPEGLPGSTSLAAILNGKFATNQRNLTYFRNKSIAGYIQTEFHLTPELDVIGGFRLTKDKKTGTSYVYVATALRQDVYPSAYRKTKPNYLIGVNYRPTEDALIYGKFSTAFVSGGSVSGIDYEPETVKAWEAGAKVDFFDRRLRTNIALFKADYDNVQAVSGGQFLTPPQPTLGTLVLREGDLKTKGFEMEATAVPVDGITLGFGAGYTKSRFTNVNPVLRPVGAVPTIRPKWTTNLSAQYETQPLFDDTTMLFRVDGVWRARMRTLPNATYPAAFDDLVYSDAMWLVNARIALRDIEIGGSKAELSVWGKNLTDSDNPLQPIDFRFAGSTNYQPARTYGVDLVFEF